VNQSLEKEGKAATPPQNPLQTTKEGKPCQKSFMARSFS